MIPWLGLGLRIRLDLGLRISQSLFGTNSSVNSMNTIRTSIFSIFFKLIEKSTSSTVDEHEGSNFGQFEKYGKREARTVLIEFKSTKTGTNK